MKLHEINISRFGIVEDDLTIKPRDGINLVAGINGSGKSTVFKALLLLLFNYTDKKLEEYVNEKTPLKTGFQLSVEFSHLDERYRIEYKFSKKGKTGTSDRKLFIGDPIPDNPLYLNSDAVAHLETVLPAQLGMAGLVSRQGETDVISAKPAERREHLKQVYDLNFDEEIESLDADISYYKDEKIPEIDKKIYALEVAEYEKDDLKEYEFTDKQIEDKKESLKAYQVKISEVEQAEEQRKDLLRALRDEKIRYENLEDDLKKYDQRVEKAQSKKTNLQEKAKSEPSDDLLQWREELADRSEFEKERDELQEEIDGIKLYRLKAFDADQLTEATQNVAKLETKLEASREQLKLVEEGVCPTCGRPFEDDDHDHFESDVESLSSELKTAKSERKELKEAHDEYKEKKEELEKLKQQKELLREKLHNIEAREEDRIVTLEDNIAREEKRIARKAKEAEEELLQVDEEIEEYNSQYKDTYVAQAEAEERLEKLKSKIESFEVPDDDGLRHEIETLEREIEKHIEIKNYNAWVEKKNKEIDQKMVEDKKKLEALRLKRDELVEAMAQYETAKTILRKDFPSFVISEMVESLQNGINDFIHRVYYKPLDIKIKEARNSINITYGSDREKDVAHLSGAEKQIVSLGYKNHLNQLMGLGVLILDEADAYYTEENAERLYEVMGSMKDQYNQLFVISHHEQAKEKLTGEHSATYFEFDNGKLAV